jgi:hypothetical protein
MADLMHLEDEAQRSGATTVEVPMTVTKGKDDNQKKLDFSVHIPKSLEDAIKIEGTRGVFGRYLNSLAVAIQAVKRQELAGDEKKGDRKRASYMELVDL